MKREGLLRRKGKKRMPADTAMGLRLLLSLLALWLACMAALTLGTAQYVLRELTDTGLGLAEYAAMVGSLDSLYEDSPEAEERRQYPGAAEYRMNDAIAHTGASVYAPSFDGYPGLEGMPNLYREVEGECETALLFLDTDNRVLRQSGDFVYFRYMTEEAWQAAGASGAEESIQGYGWLDLGEEADERYTLLRTTYSGVHSLYDYRVLRLTGYWDGSRLEPLAMAILTDGQYYRALEQAELGAAGATEAPAAGTTEVSAATGDSAGRSATTGDSGGGFVPAYTASQLDAMGLLEWEVRFDRTAQAEPGQDLVTLYALNPEMSLYEPEGPVRYRGEEEYEDLLALLGTMGFYRDSGRNVFYQSASQFSLWDLIVFSSYGVYDLAEYDAASGQPFPEPDYMLLTGLRASPLRIAMRFLGTVYIFTLLLALGLFWFLRGSLWKGLIRPLREINQGMADGWAYLSQLREKPPRWEEPWELYQHYGEAKDARQAGQNERKRLGAALEYARSAEENRRQLTSHIAHELKTPLAIVHSYAEGLQEHIAEEKREQYLRVIRAETERMDAMVLEMLDLSRLEAGKVKLSRDEFSLAALARAVFEKLERAAEAKNLEISFDFPEDTQMAADESRIAQVVENFATNAVKYTPAGGRIAVRIAREGSRLRFSVANDCEPLSAEALRKVWDTFYRADEVRSGGGTGLGLAIARSIVELHGGTCSARNTKTGVEFSFTL